MLFAFQTSIMLTLFYICSVACALPITREPDSLNTTSIVKLNINLVRLRREGIVGRKGCPKGMVWYHTQCKSLQELQDMDYYDDIPFPKDADRFPPKQTTQKDGFKPDKTNLTLSVLPLSNPKQSNNEEKAVIMPPKRVKDKSELVTEYYVNAVTDQKSEMIEPKLSTVLKIPTTIVAESDPVVTKPNPVKTVLTVTRLYVTTASVVTETTPAVTVLRSTGLTPLASDSTQVVTTKNRATTESTPTTSDSKHVMTEVTLVMTETRVAVSNLTPKEFELSTAFVEEQSTSSGKEMESVMTKPRLAVIYSTSEMTEPSYTATENAYATTTVKRNKISGTRVRDKYYTDLLLEAQSVISLLLLFSCCVAITHWLYKLLLGLYQDRIQENQDIPMQTFSKQTIFNA